jgi:4-diphosphocytidyl-2-C-methyl-D-erythritol kinase
MQALFDVPAPAKLNLFLHVTGRRPDGYHLLQSFFVPVDILDLLDFEILARGRIEREDATDAGLPADDLVTRAARLLQTSTGTRQGARIRLTKRIPMQAGMGGGSSDAASTLLALNRLWGTGLSREQLARLGLGLGADVPFFLGGEPAWVEGVGEKMTPLPWEPQAFVVVKPGAGVPTENIFRDPHLKRDTQPATMQGFAERSVSDQIHFGRNDLEPVAVRHCPDIQTCLSWLRHKGLQARMTGSGSAVFAALTHGADLSDAHPGWQVLKCVSMREHPLKHWVT